MSNGIPLPPVQQLDGAPALVWWAAGYPAHEIAQRLGVTVMAVFCRRFVMKLPSRSKVRTVAVEPAGDAGTEAAEAGSGTHG